VKLPHSSLPPDQQCLVAPVIRSGWARAAALRATASPVPAKHVLAADYIPLGAAVATVKAFFDRMLADFPSRRLFEPWDRLSVIVDRLAVVDEVFAALGKEMADTGENQNT
jgi:hypothetical protein